VTPEQVSLVREKSPEAAPVTDAVPNVRSTIPPFVISTDVAELVVPTRCSPNWNEAGPVAAAVKCRLEWYRSSP
jgi:hypothetical protein